MSLACAIALVVGCAPAAAPSATSSASPPLPTPLRPSPTSTAVSTDTCAVVRRDPGRIAFTIGDGDTNGIATIDTAGSDFVQVVEPGAVRNQPHAGTEGPRWASGDRIVFSSNRAGGPDDWHLFVVNAAGGKPQQLTAGPDGIEYHGVLSPDGTTLVYGKAVATGDPAEPLRDAGLFASDSSGHGERQLTNAPAGGTDEWPDVSPDGTLIAFSRARDDGGLFVMDADGADLRRIVGADMQPIRPRWSPDRSMLAFSSNADRFQSESANVWIVGADGEGLRQLTTASNGGQAYYPDWSSDGRHLVFVHQVAGRPAPGLAILSLETGRTCSLWEGGSRRWPGDPDWRGPEGA